MSSIVFKNFNYDTNFVNNLNQNCGIVKAHEYNDFLNSKKLCKSSLFKIITNIEKSLTYNNSTTKNINKTLTLPEGLELVKKFFESIKLADITTKILSKTSGLEEENYTVNINDKLIYDVEISKSLQDSSTGSSEKEKCIKIQVGFDSSIEAVATIAHELAHAISSHHTNKLGLVIEKENAKTNFSETSQEFKTSEKKLEESHRFSCLFESDCVGEIESHIIEKLFMIYLTKQKVISKEDLKNWLENCNNSMLHNCWTIMQEHAIISHLDCPITMQSFEKLHSKLLGSKHYTRIMERVKTMSEKDKNNRPHILSEHRFRYVVGEIFSTVWIKKYLKSSEKEQSEMLENFKEYLTKTHKTTIQDVPSKIFGEKFSFKTVISSYFKTIKKHNINI